MSQLYISYMLWADSPTFAGLPLWEVNTPAALSKVYTPTPSEATPQNVSQPNSSPVELVTESSTEQLPPLVLGLREDVSKSTVP